MWFDRLIRVHTSIYIYSFFYIYIMDALCLYKYFIYIYVYNACHIFVVLFFFYLRYINIQLVEWVIRSIAYIDDSYHLENDIILRLLNPPRARHRNGLATWSSLIGSLYINARPFSFLPQLLLFTCSFPIGCTLLSSRLTPIAQSSRKSFEEQRDRINTNTIVRSMLTARSRKTKWTHVSLRN